MPAPLRALSRALASDSWKSVLALLASLLLGAVLLAAPATSRDGDPVVPAVPPGPLDPACTTDSGCTGAAADAGDPPFARSSWDTVCRGYAGCAAAGYGNGGYSTRSSTMYWRMYSGHNCTNYVAYRMVAAGMPNTRPWSGSGMAYNWGRALRDKVDATPAVGAIAWWEARAEPVGSSGHVAYVERVISPTELLVSEDNWGGDFDWRRVTKSAGGWPTGFIHLGARAVTNLTAPTVTGTPQVGRPLQATRGTWKKASAWAFQWYAGGTAVPGATRNAYVPTAETVGEALSVRVVASRDGYTPATASSTPTAAVAPGELVLTAAPVVSGSAQVDEVLTAAPPTWSPAPTATSVRWVADGTAIPGATGWSMRLTRDLVGRSVSAVVRGARSGYTTATADTRAVGPVLDPRIRIAAPFGLSGGSRVGDTVSVAAGEFTPADAALSYAWLRDGAPVPGATGPSYVLGPDDVGARVGVRVGLDRPGYVSGAQVLRSDTAVTSRPRLRLLVGGRNGRAVVLVRVRAAGVDAPRGRVRIQVGRNVVRMKVVDGRARAVFRPLSPGRRPVKVEYAGTPLIDPATRRAWVSVTR